jgi:hypothetical protein
MDTNECNSVIVNGRNTTGKSMEEMLADMNEAGTQFGMATHEKYGRKGEW